MPMNSVPKSLICNTEIFGIGHEDILSGHQECDKIGTKKNHRRRNQPGSNPEDACARHQLWLRIETEPTLQQCKAFPPDYTNHSASLFLTKQKDLIRIQQFLLYLPDAQLPKGMPVP